MRRESKREDKREECRGGGWGGKPQPQDKGTQSPLPLGRSSVSSLAFLGIRPAPPVFCLHTLLTLPAFTFPICSRTFPLCYTLYPALSPSLFGVQGAQGSGFGVLLPLKGTITCLLLLRTVGAQQLSREAFRRACLIFQGKD